MVRDIVYLVTIVLSVAICSPAIGSQQSPVFSSWFALGSGCRARSDLPGNVEVLTKHSLQHEINGVHSVKFLLKDFTLDDRALNSGSRRFGRECAIRLNINPPPGKKILALTASTKVGVRKHPGYALDILSEFKLGAVSLGLSHRTFMQSESFGQRVLDISLASGKGHSSRLPQLGCGEPKIIGFDYSWIVSGKQSEGPTASVTLTEDKSLTIEAVLGDCDG